MKITLKILTFVIAFCLTSLTIANRKDAKHYIFQTKYDHSSVTLFDNGKFTQSKRSCTYAFTCKGYWVQNGDIITLNQEKIKKTRGQYNEQMNRSNQLVLLNDSSANYLWNIENGFGEDFIMHLDIKNTASTH